MGSMPLLGTGPSSGGAAFTPASVSGLVAWYDAAALTGLNDGDAMATWADASGNGRDLAQGSATLKPLYKTAIQNGKPVVRFDGSNDHMLFTAGADWVTGTGLTVYVVSLRRATRVNSGQVSVYANGAGNDYGALTGACLGDTEGSGTALRAYRASQLSRRASGEGDTAAHVCTYLFDGANNTLYFDGVAEAAVASTASWAIRSLLIGARWTGSFSDQAFRDYCEILVYSAGNGSTDRQAIEAYLKAKWGTP